MGETNNWLHTVLPMCRTKPDSLAGQTTSPTTRLPLLPVLQRSVSLIITPTKNIILLNSGIVLCVKGTLHTVPTTTKVHDHNLSEGKMYEI